MKQFSLLLLGLLCICCSMPENRAIECPPFIHRNTPTLEVSRVELSDSATVLDIYAKFRPKNWITFAPETRLTDNKGKEYTVLSGIGITPGKKFWMPESGEAEFKLVFPPLDKGVTSIDLTEGDHVEGGFSIWGIQLKGELPKLKLPKLKPSKEMYTEALPENEFTLGTAVIKGKLLDYKPSMGNKLEITVNKVICNEKMDVDVQPDGSFYVEFADVSFPVSTVIGFSGVTTMIMAEPGTTTQLYINLRENSRRKSKYHADAPSYGKLYYTDSPWGNIMNERKEYYADKHNGIVWRALDSKDIADMDLNTYKEYVIQAYADVQALLDTLNLLPATRQLLDFENSMGAFLNLYTVPYQIASARYQKGMIEREQFEEVSKELFDAVPEDYIDEAYIELLDDSTYQPFITGYQMMNVNDYMTSGKLASSKYPSLSSLCRAYVLMQGIEQLIPLTDEQKEQVKELPQAYADLLSNANEKLLSTLEAAKKKGGFVTNEAGDVANQDLFASIISKYSGKVILVDFWQTWCGPCRMGHERMVPMKESLKDKDIVYLYIAGDSSPETTWKNMIPDIKGEHFRLNADQWEYITGEFSIEGVPTYMVIDKEGNIRYKQVGFSGTDVIKAELLKVL